MPRAPRPGCRQPGCPEISEDGSFCRSHRVEAGRQAYKDKGSRRERGYPANWEKLRKLILARDPLCMAGHDALSTQVDHILPLERGGMNHDTNLQGLCKPCHSAKTQIEQRVNQPINGTAEVMRQVRARLAKPAAEARPS